MGMLIARIVLMLAIAEFAIGFSTVTIGLGSGLCYRELQDAMDYGDASAACEQIETGSVLMWFWSYSQWTVVQANHDSISDGVTLSYWAYVKTFNCAPYCWEDSTELSDGSSPWGNLPGASPHTQDTGTGCLMLSNDVKASVDDRLWFVESTNCGLLLPSFCRRPCPDFYNSISVTATETDHMSSLGVSASTVFTVTSSHHLPTERFDWFVNGVRHQTGPLTTFILGTVETRQTTFIRVCLITTQGDYIGSEEFSVWRTDTPFIVSSPDLSMHRIFDSVTLDCIYPGDLGTIPTVHWYTSDTDPSTSAPTNVTEVMQGGSITISSSSEDVFYYGCKYSTGDGFSPMSAPKIAAFSTVPTAPYITSLTTTTGAQSLAYMTCHATSTVIGYTSYHWFVDGVLAPYPMQIFGATSLPATVNYTCAVQDDYGWSAPSEQWSVIFTMTSFLSYETEGFCYIILGTKNSFDSQVNTCGALSSTMWWPYDQDEYDSVTGNLKDWLPDTETYWLRINQSDPRWMNGSQIDPSNWQQYQDILPNTCVRLRISEPSENITLYRRSCSDSRNVICKSPCAGGTWSPTIHASKETLDFGENSTVTCTDVSSDGSIAWWEWEVNGVPDTTFSDTLYTWPRDAPTRDTYRCIAQFDDGRRYASVDVVIVSLGAPSFSSIPHGLDRFSTGTPVTLTFTAPVPGDHEYIWKYVDDQGVQTVLSETSNSWVVDNTSAVGTFQIWCSYTMDTIGTSAETGVYITFSDGPGMPTIEYTPASSTLFAGNPCPTMTCNATSSLVGQAAFVWFNSRLEFVGNEQTTSATETFPGHQTYYCMVVDDRGHSTYSLPVSFYYAVPPVFTFQYPQDTCYRAISDRELTKSEASDMCTTNYTASSLTQLYSQTQFDNITEILNAVFPEFGLSFWIQEVFQSSKGYLWSADYTAINSTNFYNDTDLPFTQKNCLVLEKRSSSSSYQLAEISDCDERYYFLCQHACNSDEGTIASVTQDPDIPVHDTSGSVDISCTPDFSPIFIYWFRDGSPSAIAVSITTSFPNPLTSTTYNVTCIAVGPDGQTVSSNILSMTFIEIPQVQSTPFIPMSVYSTGTVVTVACIGEETAEYSWQLDDSSFPLPIGSNTSTLVRDLRGVDIPGGLLFELWECRTELSYGSSLWSPVYNLTFFPGPGIPDLKIRGASWVPYNSTLKELICANTTALAGGAKEYVWLIEGVEDPNLTTETVFVSSMTMGFVHYACRVEDYDGLSTPTKDKTVLYTVKEMCQPSPCLNQGTCYAVTYNISACECVRGFEGEFCENVTVIEIASHFNVSDEAAARGAIEDISAGVTNDLLSGLTEENYDRIAMSADAVVTYTERLIGHYGDHEVALELTLDVIALTENITENMEKMNCEGSVVEMCQDDKIQEVFTTVEDAIVLMGVTFIDSGRDQTVVKKSSGVATAATMEEKDMTISMAAMIPDVASGVMETEGAKLSMPDTLVSKASTTNYSLVAIKYKKDPYFHQESNITVDGQVYNLHIVDSAGQTVKLDPNDPIEIDFEVSGHDAHVNTNSSRNCVHAIDLAGKGEVAVVIVEYSVSATQTLRLLANCDAIPYTNAAMNVTVDSLGYVQEHQNDGDAYIHNFSDRILTVIMPLPNCTTIYLVSNYTDSSVTNSTQVLASVTSHMFYVNYWDAPSIRWKRAGTPASPGFLGRRRLLSDDGAQSPITVTDARQEGRIKFQSTIFGSFSVSRFVIVPNLIDFDNVLSNFDTLLADTPQVLALNCCILFVAALLMVLVRKADKHDQLLWKYLPLVDGDSRDRAMYTMSVHTGLKSPPVMTATPYFVIKGERGMTYKRMLCDGVRQNFHGGTVSNFVVQTPYWLGRLVSVKIWTDGLGEQPDWMLDRIVVCDVAADETYVFMCQDWLALTRGNGELSLLLPAMQPSNDELDLDLSIVSKNMLYNDHIWLSVTKRPGYSTFTRVQRFVCAVSLLYLAMLTNAMFYPTGTSEENDDTQSTGLKIGPIEFGYREVYVGIVSAVVIVIPGFLMTWIFTHRKVKGHYYKIASPHSRSSSVDSTSTAVSTVSTVESVGGQSDEPSTKTTAAMLSEAEPVNYSIAFLKKLFYEFENRRESTGSLSQSCDPRVPVASEHHSDFTPISDEDEEYRDDLQYFRMKNNNDNNVDVNRERSCLLPWWSVFIAYGLAIASIATAAILTVLYSMEWGSTTSNQWLMSLLFSTSASTFVIEPVKILVVAIILSCLFKRFSNRDMSSVAPFDKHAVPEPPPCLIPPVVDEPDTDSREMKKRKENLKLRHRLVGVWKSIGFRTTMVVVCGIVALHSDVKTSYYQNAHVKTLIDKDYLESTVRTESDVYVWLSDKLIAQTIPMTQYNGQPMTSYQTKYAQDQANYRLGPIRVIQFRVKEAVTCEVKSELHSYLKSIVCLGNYEDHTEESRDFAVNWTSCANTQCSDAYTYTSGAKWAYSQDGRQAIYGPGGYQVLWSSGHQSTMDHLAGLEGSDWMDERSRGLEVEVTVFNPNTRLFTQAKTLIELPSFGSTITTVTVKSARLYPYTTVWDYLVLLVHLFFIVLQIIRLCMLVSDLIKPEEGQTRWAFVNLATCADVILALAAFVVYVIRIVLTSELLERVINETDKFSSFDAVFVLDQIFVSCMGMCLFIAILMCLLPLSLNYNLYIMKKTVSTASPQLSSFGFLLVVFLFAFATYFTIARGSVTKNLCSLLDSLTSLLTVVLGHGKFRGIGGETEMANSSGFDYVIFRLMYGIFCFGSAIFMINLAITILSAYMTDVKDACYKKGGRHSGYDPKLNKFMWDSIEQWIRKMLFLQDSKTLTNDGHDNPYQYHGLPRDSKVSFSLPGTSRLDTTEELLRKGKFY